MNLPVTSQHTLVVALLDTQCGQQQFRMPGTIRKAMMDDELELSLHLPGSGFGGSPRGGRGGGRGGEDAAQKHPGRPVCGGGGGGGPPPGGGGGGG
eukprot:COSAG02_NODE_32640_length_513_cov_0.714976_1_plen_95_part_10